MIKYIIVKKEGKLKHYKSDIYSHNDIASDNGIIYFNDIIEKGLIIDNKPLILECSIVSHNKKHYYDKLSFDPSILRARQLESSYIYGINYKGL
jgi:hypothetical protein